MKIVAAAAGSNKKPAKANVALKKAGFEYMLFDLRKFCSEYLLDNKEKCYQGYLEEKGVSTEERIFLSEEPYRMEEAVRSHLEHMKKLLLKNIAGYAPTLPVNTKRNDLDDLIKTLTAESFRVCKQAGCKYLIIDPVVKMTRGQDTFETNTEFYLLFAEKAKEFDMKILIKNGYSIFNGRFARGYMADMHKFKDFIDRLNRKAGADIYAVCLDVGVCNLLGQNIYEMLLELGSRVEAVIMRENDGVRDSSFLPFTVGGSKDSGKDWAEIINGLRNIRFDGLLIFDLSGQRKLVSHLLWDELTRYMKRLADFLYWQINMEHVIRRYESRVLFGAGNMCRNYMKNYGDKYPPLFTCDNNAKLWGTEFCGLEVKSPEALKDLPEDCGIFICNIYYREIEEQLHVMGIDKNIEYFNDEYMPSFYHDRLDMTERER